MEGLIFGGAYLRRDICVSQSIGLALYLEVNLPFLLCFTSYLRAISQGQAPGGLIFGGAYFRNFTVCWNEFIFFITDLFICLFLYVYFFADTSDRSTEATQYFCVNSTSQQSRNNENHYLSPGEEGAGTLYNSLYRETPPARGTIFMLLVYERVSSL